MTRDARYDTLRRRQHLIESMTAIYDMVRAKAEFHGYEAVVYLMLACEECLSRGCVACA